LSRRLRILVGVLLAVVALGAIGLWALPHVVRRVAVTQLTSLTGRATSIEAVHLNLFTGRLAVVGLRMARRPGRGPEAFIEFERLDVHVAPTALVHSEIRLTEMRLSRPAVRITRTGSLEFDFSDLIRLFVSPVNKQEPSSWTFVLGRFELAGGTVVVDDAFMSPPRQWRIEDIGLEASGITTKASSPPGRLRLAARLGDTRLDATSQSVVLTPASISLDLSVKDFDVARVRPYLPPDLPATPEAGKAGLSLRLERVRAGEALAESSVSGEIRLDGLAVAQRGRTDPFLRLGHIVLAIKRMDFLARRIELEGLDVDGLDLKAARDKNGDIDLLAALRSPAPADAPAHTDDKAAPAEPPAATPGAASSEAPRAPPEHKGLPEISLARLGLRSGAIAVTDEAVSPARSWKIDGITVDGAALGTASDAGTLQVRAQVTAGPGAAKPFRVALDADSIKLIPLAASARFTLDGFALADIGPYWPESLPAVARQGTVGVALKAAVAQGDTGLSRAIVSGDARVEGLSVLARGQTAPFVTIPKLSVGIKQADAIAHSVTIGTVEIEGTSLKAMRDEHGRIDLLSLMSGGEAASNGQRKTGARGPGASPGSPPSSPPRGSPSSPPAGAQPPASPAVPATSSAAASTSPATASTSPAGVSTSPAAAWRLSLERFAFSKGTLTFEDRQVSPPATLALGDVKASAERISWPFTSPGTFAFSVSMPGGGSTYGKGTAQLEPLNVQVSLSTRDSPIAPYQRYFPFPAQFGGLFNGDSLSEIQRGPKGELILASRGKAWASNLEVKAPGQAEPVMSLNSMVIQGIDFSWPNYALVEKVMLLRPKALVERDAQGQINLRTLFTPPGGKDGKEEKSAPEEKDKADEKAQGREKVEEKAPAAPEPPRAVEPPAAPAAPEPAKAVETPAAPATPAPAATESASAGGPAPGGESDSSQPGLLQTMVLDFTEIEIRDGFARFVDKTLTPPFSEDISRLSLKVDGLSNILGRPERTTLSAQGLIGKDGALDMKGNLSGIGETLRGDLVAELHDFSLPSANPYMESMTSWVAQSGKLQAKIHYQIEGDRITAQHDLILKGLKVEKTRSSDEAKQRIGIPLGLAVALLKDSHGDIDFTLPISGTLSDKKFNWADAMWTAAKQVIAKVVLSPFRAIGRLFTGGGAEGAVDKLEINPVTFAPGSAVIAPSLESQMSNVAEFLNRSPNVKLALSPVLTTADADSVKVRSVNRRIEAFRREKSLPDQAAALRAFYQQELPEAALPKTPDEQIAGLVEREQVPEQGLTELVTRRLEAVRNDLVKARGIATDRVVMPPSPTAPAPVSGGDAQGRVEFTIVGAEG